MSATVREETGLLCFALYVGVAVSALEHGGLTVGKRQAPPGLACRMSRSV